MKPLCPESSTSQPPPHLHVDDCILIIPDWRLGRGERKKLGLGRGCFVSQVGTHFPRAGGEAEIMRNTNEHIRIEMTVHTLQLPVRPEYRSCHNFHSRNPC